MTESSPPSAVLATVAEMLQSARLDAVNFHRIVVERLDAPAPGPGQVYPVDMRLEFQATESTVVYRVAVTVTRPDLHAEVLVAVQYGFDSADSFQDAAVAQMFGEKVALPAVYPYARAKMHEVTIDLGTEPIVLGILDFTRLTLNAEPQTVDLGLPLNAEE